MWIVQEMFDTYKRREWSSTEISIYIRLSWRTQIHLLLYLKTLYKWNLKSNTWCYKFGTLIYFVKPCIIRLLALLQETCLGVLIIWHEQLLGDFFTTQELLKLPVWVWVSDMDNKLSVTDPEEARGLWPTNTLEKLVKTKDGYQRRQHRFHVSGRPLLYPPLDPMLALLTFRAWGATVYFNWSCFQCVSMDLCKGFK